MNNNKKCIVSVNAGSSSIKLDVLNVDDHQEPDKRLSLAIAGIGQSEVLLTVLRQGQRPIERPITAVDRAEAIEALFTAFAEEASELDLIAVGHRVVHGGLRSSSVLITDEVMDELGQFAPFDPEHMPAALELIALFRQRFATLPHVACFDTAFFSNLPEVAQVLPLPSLFSNLGLKRYGFHGLSYSYLATKLDQLHTDRRLSKVVYAHLGSGASLAAVVDGRPIETTMSFTPASGIVMSSRSGDLDPGIALFLQQRAGLSLEDFTHMVNHQAGLLGVSSLSADMKSLLDAAPKNHLARLAVDLFCYRVRMAVGSLSAAMGGLDTIVFSGGIGERSVPVRAQILDGLDYLGVELDSVRNAATEQLISSGDSRVSVYVLPTDESQTIAREVINVVSKQGEVK